MYEAARNLLSYCRSRLRHDDFHSSLSDNNSYPAFCERAAHEDILFRSFRDSVAYSEILEHVSYTLGKRYLKAIRQDADLLASAKSICESDTVGSPRRFNYVDVGMASPTTLRYLKVVKDLVEAFGSLAGMDIAEIGVGYGGQCRVLSSLYQLGGYSLIDLPPVLSLAERYLVESGVDSPVRLVSALDVPELEPDLLLSNYAFSELRRDVQEMYMRQVVSRSRRGYMTFNQITPSRFGSMSAKDFAERVGGAILPERPRSYPGNRIIVWGT